MNKTNTNDVQKIVTKEEKKFCKKCNRWHDPKVECKDVK